MIKYIKYKKKDEIQIQHVLYEMKIKYMKYKIHATFLAFGDEIHEIQLWR